MANLPATLLIFSSSSSEAKDKTRDRFHKEIQARQRNLNDILPQYQESVNATGLVDSSTQL